MKTLAFLRRLRRLRDRLRRRGVVPPEAAADSLPDSPIPLGGFPGNPYSTGARLLATGGDFQLLSDLPEDQAAPPPSIDDTEPEG